MAALSRGPLPPKQKFWLCAEPDCRVIYFGDAGAVLEVEQLYVEPGFKNPVDGLLCYCFGHLRSEVERQIRETGSTTIPEAIRLKTSAGDCACEVRNPTGNCCLGEVHRFVRSIKGATAE